ncbi:hypothetical protein IU458_15235 [Nocardia nova]|nr:hypothetical protein [Nocardia nova]
MPNYMDQDPDDLRRRAEDHGRRAKKLREWGQIPHDWLSEFPSGYGTIAEPVRAALQDYYQRRHDNAERLADNHDRARDRLIEAANALEHTENTSGHRIRNAGAPSSPPGDGPNSHGLIGSPPPPRPGVPPSSPQPSPLDRTPTGMHSGPAESTTDSDGHAFISSAHDPAPTGPSFRSANTTIEDAAPEGVPVSALPGASESGPSQVAEFRDTAAPAEGYSYAPVPPAGPQGFGWAPGAPPGPAGSGPGVGPLGSGATPSLPRPLAPGTFASVAHAPERRRALPPLVVGDPEDDLGLARTLLSAILAAVGTSTPDVNWAVAVLRTPNGAVVMLTSSEGRGWLPAGLHLPSEVVSPWQLAEVFGVSGQIQIALLEDVPDSATRLVNFARLAASRTGVRLSALASSAMISSEIIADLDAHVATEGFIAPAEACVDLSVPGPGLVDRLALTGADWLKAQAETISDRDIRARCIELARIADERLRSVSPATDSQVATRRTRRARLLTILGSGPLIEPYPGRPIGVSAATPSGDRMRAKGAASVLAGDTASGTSSVAVLERRADELLALAGSPAPDRQTLRDALYVYGEVEASPLVATLRFGAGPSAAVVTADSAAPVPAVVNGSAAPDSAGSLRRA